MLKIDDLGMNGEGIAHAEGGKAIFLPFYLPGEELEGGKIIKVSNFRVKPQCPYFTFCGGCSLEHLNYKSALEFKQNKVNILISTTVIEVGVDVPNATMIVIFDANRFGLSTLHQLRGRVGRSDLASTCILISNNDTKRLEIMAHTNDGFQISEEDFKLRGHGDLFGTKQSGDMTFKVADLTQDYKILLQAKEDSYQYLLQDDNNDTLKKSLITSIVHS